MKYKILKTYFNIYNSCLYTKYIHSIIVYIKKEKFSLFFSKTKLKGEEFKLVDVFGQGMAMLP